MESETWTFSQPFLVIGRRPDCDLVLDQWQVSRRHAYLQLIEGRYYCVDLGSRTGTHGGQASERSGWLDEGRAIQIGPYAVRPEWPVPARRDRGPLPRLTLELPGRAIGQALCRMDQPLFLVGRSPACRIRIAEPDVSKFHCSLVMTHLGAWVVDLLGQKGVYVNDRPVRFARLEEGDELRVGRHSIRPRYEAALPPLEPSPDQSATTAGGLATIEPQQFRLGLPPGLGPVAGGPPMAPAWPNAPGGLPAMPAGPGRGLVDPSIAAILQHFSFMQQQMFDQFHQSMMMMFEAFATLHRETSGSIRREFDEIRQLSREIDELRAETARLAEAAARPTYSRPTNGHGPFEGRLASRLGPLPPPDRKPAPGPPEADIHAQLCLRLASIQSERQNRWQKILGMMSSKS